MFLREVANIRIGLVTARKQAKGPEIAQKTQDYRLLSLKCIKEPGILDLSLAEPYTTKEPLKKDFLTKRGDILVRLSAPYTAVLIDAESENFVVPSHFAIIRVDQSKADSGYILWLLRQRDTLQNIYKNVSGTAIFGTINSNFFAELPVNDMPLEKQKIIGDLLKLSEREQSLLAELTKAKAEFSRVAIQEAYTILNKGKRK